MLVLQMGGQLAGPAAAGVPDTTSRAIKSPGTCAPAGITGVTVTAPNQLWVTVPTYVPTWAEVAYVCFIVDDYSRMIVGWLVAGHMRTTMVLDAIEMAAGRGETRCRTRDVTPMPDRSSPRSGMASVRPDIGMPTGEALFLDPIPSR
jgi:transposase InsO family protein